MINLIVIFVNRYFFVEGLVWLLVFLILVLVKVEIVLVDGEIFGNLVFVVLIIVLIICVVFLVFFVFIEIVRIKFCIMVLILIMDKMFFVLYCL